MADRRRIMLRAALIGLLLLCLCGAAAAQDGVPTALPNEIVYVVQPGDTLARIAARFAITTETLAARNALSADPAAGTRLIVPPPGATALPGLADPTPRGLPTAAPTPTPVAEIPFGLGAHVFSFSYPRQMTAAGMTWARSFVRWTRGADITAAQGAVDAARSNGFAALLTVVGDPAQMADDLSRYTLEFVTFIGEVAALQPDAIEVWTAPNVPESWAAGQIGSVAYAQMLALAFEAIKRVSPSTLVIAAAPDPSARFNGCTGAGCDESAFLRGLAAAGGADSADCIGVRYTQGALPPDAVAGDERGESYRYYYPLVIARYAEIFPNKPLCMVEAGYLAGRGLDVAAGLAWSARTDIQDQAEWLARLATLARQSGRVRLMIVWNADSTAFSADNPLSAYAIARDGQCLACITLGAALGVR